MAGCKEHNCSWGKYAPDHDPMNNLKLKDVGNISVYARGDDYHDVVKKFEKNLEDGL